MKKVNDKTSLTEIKIWQDGQIKEAVTDHIAKEAPLELLLEYYKNGQKIRRNVALVMRSPGRDLDLSIGLLYADQVIGRYQDLASFKYLHDDDNTSTILIQLKKDVDIDESRFNRNAISNSSCGLCSRESAAELFPPWVLARENTDVRFRINDIINYSEKLGREQSAFNITGGMHACALFDPSGEIDILAEDVGRHNALDKLLGEAIRRKRIPIKDRALLLSGRCSYELIYKAAMVKIPLIVSIGAPSSLAVEWAKELEIGLIGFLKKEKLNVYNDNDVIGYS